MSGELPAKGFSQDRRVLAVSFAPMKYELSGSNAWGSSSSSPDMHFPGGFSWDQNRVPK